MAGLGALRRISLQELMSDKALVGMVVTSKCVSVAGLLPGKPVAEHLGSILIPGGRIAVTALQRYLQRVPVGAVVLGSELPPVPHAAYNMPTYRLGPSTKQSGVSGDASVAAASSGTAATTQLPHLAPVETSVMRLHLAVGSLFPAAACFRYHDWRLDAPASEKLTVDPDAPCSMSMRFLQHFVDRHLEGSGSRA